MHNSSPPRATLSQVAKLSGVSVKTASRALNGERYVAAETADRVRKAAEKLGFRLNAVARDFRSGARTPSVALLIGDVANPFYARIARGAERRLHAARLRLVLASTEENPVLERELVNEMIERRVTAIMIVTSSTNHDYVDRERELGTPIIFLDRAPSDVAADTIVLDNADGIADAVAHFISTGHERIGLIGYLRSLSADRERLEAYQRAMAEAKLDGSRYVRTDCHNVAATEAATIELLSENPPPTALIATNNRLTVGVLRALRTSRRTVAFIGFDDFDLADVFGISVIAHDADLMGASAANIIIDRLAGDRAPLRRVVLPTQLVIRGSSETEEAR